MKNRTHLLLPLILGLSLPACTLNFKSVPAGSSAASRRVANHMPFAGNPQFKSFPEIAYYSYAMSEDTTPALDSQDDSVSSDSISPIESDSSSTESTSKPVRSSKERPNTSEEVPEESEENTRQDYEDEKGRYHYPIDIQESYVFSNFIYFSFVSENCEFLEERIGNGNIDALVVETEFFSEKMIVLKNEDKLYSCLLNGARYGGSDGGYYEFSAHKFIEGFDLVKDLEAKYPITVKFGDSPASLTNISFGGKNAAVFNIDTETIINDESAIEVSVNELRERFGLEIDPMFEQE